jgi:4-amino-4-deoxy-L-arabinose transferase-like glycosyltransferase
MSEGSPRGAAGRKAVHLVIRISERLHLPLLALLAAVMFSVNLGGYDLWPADEPRYAQVAREMLDSGNWLSPTVNGESYLEKPPLLFWSQALVSLPFGDINEWTARVPSALSGVAVLVLTYLLARGLFGAQTAFYAALFLLTCQRYWWQARTGQIDMLLTACMMLALYALWRWHNERRAAWLLPVYLGMAAGLLAKGPPAILFVLLFIWSFYWNDKESRRATHWIAGTLAALAITLAWYIPARLLAGDSAEVAVQSGIGENLFRNTIGRFVMGVSKAQWPWYYLETIPADLLPWTLLLPWALPWMWRNRNESSMHRVLWCWCVPALIFFSISIGKRAVYILPLFPVFAIILAASLDDFLRSSEPKRGIVAWGWAAGLFLLGGVGIGAGIWQREQGHLLPMLVFGVVALGLGVWVAMRTGAARSQQAPLAMSIGMVGVYLVAPFSIFPLVNDFKGAANFCAPLREANVTTPDYRLYSVGFSREEYIYYADHHHEPVLMDLVGRKDIAPDDLIDTAKFQRDVKKTLGESVEDIDVADWGNITDAELQTLRDAARKALEEEEHFDHARLPAFESALHEEVVAFWNDFTAPGAAFIMTQESDWKWLLALEPELRGAKLIHAEGVGRRKVLLLVNR